MLPPMANPKLRAYSSALRQDQTPAEARLWAHLRNRRLDGCKFRRQLPIGRYIADFACKELKLVVEVDGSQHTESAYDAERDAWLNAHGWRVLRFWNNDVLSETGGALDTIVDAIRGLQEAAREPSPSQPSAGPLPLPLWGRGAF